MSDETTTPNLRPGSGASIERRVERLETRQDEMQKSLNGAIVSIELVKTEQGHLKELMQARFGTIELGVNNLIQEMKAMSAAIQSGMADPNMTPAGRQGMEAIKRLHDRIDKIESLAMRTHDETEERFTEMDTLEDQRKQRDSKADARMGVIGAVIGSVLTALAQIILGGQQQP